ncbi:DUF4230 domain-containing protein [Robertmurraya kyonggiensis]|uniref:DUF4230 domain-containing protein n=1 Tax=Robertmurraya kyonggiensis TaxID=1037680 RepID=UPI001FEA1DBD|nr:DUF4230 domain-containing protein [Robertmurraya kyonggiensis]
MTKRDDEILAQLEAIRNELKEGNQQTASTVAVETYRKTPSLKLGMKKWQLKIILLILLFMIVGTFIGIGSYKLFAGAEPKVEKGSFIEKMKELSSLASSQAFVKAVIEKEDNQIFGKEITTNIPGTKRKILLVVPGTVTAGVDLDGIDGEHVSINEEEKTLEITLPHAKIIQEPSLEFEQVQTYSVEGIFRAEVDWEEAYELAAEAKTLVKEEAIAQGILQMAETNAEKTLKEFYSQLGYEVSVQYED